MRLRFFCIILIVLSASSAAMIYLHSIYLWQTKINLIDDQLRDIASTLVQAKFAELSEETIKNADDIISEELGENRIGKFFIVRDNDGNKIFESVGSKLLPITEVPRSPQRLTIAKGEHFIRILNLRLPRVEDRTLQVGLVMSRELLIPGYLSQESFTFIGIALALGLIIAWTLASTLLKPINDLAKFMVISAEHSFTSHSLEPIPENLKKAASFFGERDEYSHLIEALDKLIVRMNRGYKMTRLWTYQMAHELKTPLAIISVEVQSGPHQNQKKIEERLSGLEKTITSFLSWAELESVDPADRPFANRIVPMVQEVCQSFEALNPKRIELVHGEDFHVLCEPEHLRQCLNNLLSNALGFSEGKVVVTIKDSALIIADQGPGIPATVYGRLGDPFNRGSSKINNKKGQGLGLAWVFSIARLYGWDFTLQSQTVGTIAKIRFQRQL